MSKRLECPIDGCHATIEVETDQEVMAQVEDHAAESHPDLELDEEAVENIRSNIRDV